jgi:copper chaperone
MNLRIALAPVLCSALLLAAACAKEGGEPESAQKPAASVQTAPAEQPVKVVEAAVAEEAKMGCDGDSEAKSDCSGAGGCNQWDEAAAEVIKRELPADAEWRTFAVSGMTCGGCERRVIANVGELDGVLAVEADAELGQVRIAVAPGNSELAGAAADRIGSLGYQVAR